MKMKNKSLASIKREITRHKNLLNRVHAARQAVRGHTTVPVGERGTSAEPLRARLAATPGQRTASAQLRLQCPGGQDRRRAPGEHLTKGVAIVVHAKSRSARSDDVRLSTITRYVEATGEPLALTISPVGVGVRRLRRKIGPTGELAPAQSVLISIRIVQVCDDFNLGFNRS